VWIIFQTGAVPHHLTRSRPPASMSLQQLLEAKRDPVPKSSDAWWAGMTSGGR
jgi:hypothetical protein